ncbi:unnamed protein product [Rotaria socialis]|uniref:Toll-interacting protein n=1 Tax=Rotaria socialis TaxID=392032 RepID=A0A818JYT6_9BILA|nr:unnamed protein product [Rotaria socialis]CAF3761768.1 unnamed protein product [Rotaria socialis]CAF4481981.1 unnamed protein product [Rotaria socialis]CAF4493875.1 unnamed protein product [Rotaria socialis]
MASAVDSSNHTASNHGNILPKFSDYRSRVMLGDLPQDFLRIQLVESQLYRPSAFDHALEHDSNFIGYFTFSITEAKLIKNSGPLGLLRMDPYVRFQIGSISNETPTATGGGKNPQWNISYRINLFKGMERIYIELFDQRSFTEDNFIGECRIEIPQEVISGQTKLSWYPLMGRETSANENQGEILVMMSLMPIISDQPSDIDDVNLLNSSTGSSSTSSPSNSVVESAAMYSSDDIRTIEEMFPAIDRQIIIDLLEKHGGNKDLVVNHLLQNIIS